MFRESEIEKWLHCVLIVNCASNAYKNDIEGESVVSVMTSERFRLKLKLCGEISVLFPCILQCWERICVRTEFEFNEVNVSVSVRDLSGV